MGGPAPRVLPPHRHRGGTAHHSRTRHGAVRVVRRGLRRGRFRVHDVHPAGHLHRGRPGAVRRGAAPPHPDPAQDVVPDVRGVGDPAGARADPRHRNGRAGHPRMVHHRRSRPPAVGDLEGDLRRVGRAPAGVSPGGACRPQGSADSAGARRDGDLLPHRDAARPRYHRGPGHHPHGSAVVRGSAGQGVRIGRRRPLPGGGGARPDGRVPLRAYPAVAEPRQRPAGHRVPVAAGAVLPGRRWVVRSRPGSEPSQVELSSQRAQRLHLRDHRRGTRPGRVHRGHRTVRAAGLHGPAHRGAGTRSVHEDPGGDVHRLDPRAGRHQHRLRHRAPARDGTAVAPGLRGRNVHRHHTSGTRAARQHLATRARGGGRTRVGSRREVRQTAQTAGARALLAGQGVAGARRTAWSGPTGVAGPAARQALPPQARRRESESRAARPAPERHTSGRPSARDTRRGAADMARSAAARDARSRERRHHR